MELNRSYDNLKLDPERTKNTINEILRQSNRANTGKNVSKYTSSKTTHENEGRKQLVETKAVID